MNTKQFIQANDTPVGFQVSRGGQSRNSGHVSFLGETTINAYTGALFLRDGEYFTETGNRVGLTEAEAQTNCGRINIDGEYNTIYVQMLSECSDNELEIIAASQNYDGYRVQQLKEILKNK